jgi:hypothetical protein
MAVNKPVGDNARKGAVKKRSQVKTKLGGVDEAQQKGRRVHGGEKAGQEEKGGQESSRACGERRRRSADDANIGSGLGEFYISPGFIQHQPAHMGRLRAKLGLV